MKARLAISALVAALLPLSAKQVQDHDRYLPLIQDGGGWTTRITLVNLGNKATGFDLLFRPNTGMFGQWNLGFRPTTLTVIGSDLTGTLPAGGMTVLETSGASDSLTTGYAVLVRFGQEKIAAEVTLRNSTTGAVFSLPLSPAREDFVVLPFDNTDGASTQFAWLSETDFAVMDAIAYDHDGRELHSHSFEFFAADSLAQHVFDTAERFPALKDRRGLMVIRMTYPTVGFYDESTFAAAAIHHLPGGAVLASTSLSTDAPAPRRY